MFLNSIQGLEVLSEYLSFVNITIVFIYFNLICYVETYKRLRYKNFFWFHCVLSIFLSRFDFVSINLDLYPAHCSLETTCNLSGT